MTLPPPLLLNLPIVTVLPLLTVTYRRLVSDYLFNQLTHPCHYKTQSDQISHVMWLVR